MILDYLCSLDFTSRTKHYTVWYCINHVPHSTNTRLPSNPASDREVPFGERIPLLRIPSEPSPHLSRAPRIQAPHQFPFNSAEDHLHDRTMVLEVGVSQHGRLTLVIDDSFCNSSRARNSSCQKPSGKKETLLLEKIFPAHTEVVDWMTEDARSIEGMM